MHVLYKIENSCANELALSVLISVENNHIQINPTYRLQINKSKKMALDSFQVDRRHYNLNARYYNHSKIVMLLVKKLIQTRQCLERLLIVQEFRTQLNEFVNSVVMKKENTENRFGAGRVESPPTCGV